MRLADYHIHSACSSDGHNTMLEMALASHARGVTQLCFTDHCDIDDFMTGDPDPNCFCNKGDIVAMYRQALAAAPGDMRIFLGIELGEGNHDPEKAKRIAASEELDFVLGSIHNVKNTPDFYHLDYRDEASCRGYIARYIDELIELSEVDCFDVMAHIGYPNRYMRKAGFDVAVNTENFRDRLEVLLKSLITHGKGIELNCAGYRADPAYGAIPTLDVLRLYRELGGEIITVGSDAHKTDQAGRGLNEGYAALRELGFGYVAVYEKRKPSFEKI